MRIIHEQIKLNPRMFDVPIEQYKVQLKNNLIWLDQSFGRAWKIIRNVGGKKYTEPCIYCEGNEYESLVPSADLGNYCFFVLNDPTEINEGVASVRCSIIFWMDLRSVFDAEGIRDTETVKNEIVKFINMDMWAPDSMFTIQRVYEEGKNVFNGFTLDENDNQFMMHPYAAFRVEGNLQIPTETC